MSNSKLDPDPHKFRPREVKSHLCPGIHLDGHNARNFEADTLTMLGYPTPILSAKHRKFLRFAIIRRVKINPLADDGREVLLTDTQWRNWQDIRTMFMASRRFRTRTVSRTTSPAFVRPLSIPLPEAAA